MPHTVMDSVLSTGVCMRTYMHRCVGHTDGGLCKGVSDVASFSVV